MIKKLMAVVLLFCWLPFSACAADGQQYQSGVHYTELERPLFNRNRDKVEVTEFFWYGCGHCYHFEPLVKAWKSELPEGAVMVYSPAIWRDVMELHARAYYTAEVLGVLDLMHEKLFVAMNEERNPLASEADIAALFVANGVEKAAFQDAFRGFAVNGLVRQADSRMRGAKVQGTPGLMVNGKYTITAKQAGSQENMLKVARYLVEQELALQ